MQQIKYVPLTLGSLTRLALTERAWRTTMVVHDKLVITVTQTLVRGKVGTKNNEADLRITVGRPNYRMRQVIKRAKRDRLNYQGATFLQWPPHSNQKARWSKLKQRV
jgi:hypothetical protein